MEEKTNPDHDLEVIATKNGKHYKLEMSSSGWSNFLLHKKKKGYTYLCYQKGFSQYKLESNEPNLKSNRQLIGSIMTTGPK